MGWRGAIAALKEFYCFRIQRDRIASIGEHKPAVLNPAIRMKTRCNFGSNLGVGVQHGDSTVRGPTLEETFALRDCVARRNFYAGHRCVDFAPAAWTELA